MSRRLSDEEVAEYLAMTETERGFNDFSGEAVYMLAKEVQERRAADTPQDIRVQAGQQVLEALRARTQQLVAEGRCPHACYHYESMSQIPICSDCGADITEHVRTWID